MGRKRIAMTVLACLVATGGAAIWIRQQTASARRLDCLSALRSIGTAIALYRQDCSGELPPDLAALAAGSYLSSAWMLVCPRGSRPAGSWTDVAEWADYTYVHWPSATDGHANSYPLVYDRRMSNHVGKGINVLLVEQTVHPASPSMPGSHHGQLFWDEGAKWLQGFAKEHPGLVVLMPEGVGAAD